MRTSLIDILIGALMVATVAIAYLSWAWYRRDK